MKKILTPTSILIIVLLTLSFLTSRSVSAQFAKGADISWTSEMESAGYAWYNDSGIQEDVYQILKDHGMNAIRLRVWVNPADGWCDLNDMLYLAARARDAGMDIMLTIHYSDSWADPGKQYKPGAWTGLSTQGLYDQVYQYTYDVISTMQAQNITPKWVQIGNETNDGMLWEDGRASANMQTYAWLVNSGHNAVKDVNSSIKTIVHLANGDDNSLYQWNIGGLISNGANFDIIGMSLYPTPTNWQNLTDLCYQNMQDMRSRYGKDVMICEIGMRQDEPEVTKSFVEDMIAKTQSAGGLGVFYWEPQIYNGWKSYGKGAWQEDGRPSIALDAFIGSCDPSLITPYLRVDAGSWQQTSTAVLSAGSSLQLGPQPVTGGSWTWSGPNGYWADTRQITISNIQANQAGQYVATYTNDCGAQSFQNFSISVSGSNITVRARGTNGSENINLRVNGALVESWMILSTTYQEFSVSTGESGPIEIQFDNDGPGRDVQVDYVVVNGNTLQAENQINNTGVWQNGSCGGAYSEWMHCNGSITFGSTSSRQSQHQDRKGSTTISIYPNPLQNHDKLTIAGLKEPATLQVLTIDGRTVQQSMLKPESPQFHVKVKPGIYLLLLHTSSGTIQHKLQVN